MRCVTETVNRLGQFDVHWQADVLIIWLAAKSRDGAQLRFVRRQNRRVYYCPQILNNFVTRHTTAPHALRLYVNSEYCLNRYLDGISTLAELLRNPDRSSGI